MKYVMYGIRVVSGIGIVLMLSILSLKTLVFISEAGVDDVAMRICTVFIEIGTLYLMGLVWWYIALGKESYQEFKKKHNIKEQEVIKYVIWSFAQKKT